MGFLVILLVIVLLVFLSVISFGLSIIRGILSIFIPSLRSNRYTGQRHGGANQASYENEEQKRSKIFEKSEGEYADYEEIK